MAWKVGMGYRFIKPTGHGTTRSRRGSTSLSLASLTEAKDRNDPDLHVPYLYLQIHHKQVTFDCHNASPSN